MDKQSKNVVGRPGGRTDEEILAFVVDFTKRLTGCDLTPLEVERILQRIRNRRRRPPAENSVTQLPLQPDATDADKSDKDN